MDSFFTSFAFSLPLLYIPLFTVFSCLSIHYLVYSRRVAQWRKSNIPFLKPSFLIGHKYFLDLIKNSWLVPVDRIYRENKDKDVVGFFMGTLPMVMIRSPALIKQVFTKNSDKTFENGFIGSSNDEFAKNMIPFNADKESWKLHRRTLSPMFAPSLFSGETFAKVRTQIERMWAYAEETHLNGNIFDVKKVTINFLVDSASSSLLSLDANSYEKEGDLHRLFTSRFSPSFAKVMRTYTQMQFSGAHAFQSLRFFTERQISALKNLIRQQMKQKSLHSSYGNDLVDFLMRLKDEEQDSKRGSEIDIGDQMINFGFIALFGGTCDMPSDSWCTVMAMHLLSLHPEHQERIRNEVAEVMQKHNTSEFTYEVIQDLTFAEQCILETIRLFPTTPFISRVCSEDFQPLGTDYTFKKGDLIMVNPYSVHRDPKYFTNPDKFEPERFSPENRKAMSPDIFLGFGFGPRKCPGGKIGVFRVATIVASLVYKFDIKPHSHLKQIDAADLHPQMFSMLPREELLVNTIPREIMAH